MKRKNAISRTVAFLLSAALTFSSATPYATSAWAEETTVETEAVTEKSAEATEVKSESPEPQTQETQVETQEEPALETQVETQPPAEQPPVQEETPTPTAEAPTQEPPVEPTEPQTQASEGTNEPNGATETNADEPTRGVPAQESSAQTEEIEVSTEARELAAPLNESTFEIEFSYGSGCVDLEDGNAIASSGAVEVESSGTTTVSGDEYYCYAIDEVVAAYESLPDSKKAKKSGKRLSGWTYGSGTELDEDSVLTEDMTFTAVWTDEDEFDVKFVYGDDCVDLENGDPLTDSGKIAMAATGEDSDGYYYLGSDVLDLFEAFDESNTPSLYGYTLQGWTYLDADDDEHDLESDSTFRDSTVFYAVWEKNPLTIKELANGEVEVSNGSKTIVLDDDATVSDLVKAVYEVFEDKDFPDGDWSFDVGGTEEVLRHEVDEDEDLSDWFRPDDGTELIAYGDDEELFRFMLFDDEDDDDQAFAVKEDVELYALTYDLNYDGAPTVSAVSYRSAFEEIARFDVEDPEREGYSFAGWFYGDGEDDPEMTIYDVLDGDTTAYARWVSENAVKVTYDLNVDGDSFELVKYSEAIGTDAATGSTIDPTTYVEVEDQMFAGWYSTPDDSSDEDLTGETPDAAAEYDPSTKTARVYAHWADALTATFCDPDGNAYYDIESVAVADGGTIGRYAAEGYEMPMPTTAPGESFVGWFVNGEGNAVTLDTKINKADADDEGIVKLIAKFSSATVDLTFDPNGGSLSNPSEATRTIAQGATVGTFPEVFREGYDLEGWFDATEGGNEAFAATVPEESATYYAHWTKTPNKVTSLQLPESYMTVSSVDELRTLYEDYVYSPSDAENASFKWTSSDESVIRIADSSAGTSWTNPFAYVGDGETWLRLSTEDGSVYDRCYVKIKKPDDPIPPTERIDILLNGNVVTNQTLEVEFGEDPQLTSDPNDPNFIWSSSNEGVITVLPGGRILTRSAGTARVTVTAVDGSASASVTIKVKESESNVSFLKFTRPGPDTITIGDSVDLDVKYGALNSDNAKFTWSSNAPDILSVTETGESVEYAYGGSYGTVVVTVSTTDGKLSASKTFVVKKKDEVDWTPDQDTYYVITFDSMGGSAVPSARLKSGSQVPLTTPAREGYTFDGWYMERETAMTKVTSLVAERDLTLYAHWIEIPKPETVEITFDKRNGEDAVRVILEKGSAIGAFPQATRTGYTLLGWYTDDEGGEKVESDMTVDRDMTFYAHWSNDAENGRFVLSLDPNGGNVDGNPRVIVPEERLVRDSYVLNDVSAWTPVRQGFEFKGWYDAKEDGVLVYGTDGKAVAGTTYWPTRDAYKGEKDLAVYARWEQNPETFELRFDSRGGNTISPRRYDVGTTVSEFPTPTREGYRFLGWFAEATAGDPLTSVVMNADKTIYAQWEMIDDDPEKGPFTITFDSQGGTPCDSVTGAAGTEIDPLPETLRDKYVFVGWFDRPENGVKVLSVTLDHDMTLYANWELDLSKVKRYVVTFDWMNGGTITESVNFTDTEGVAPTITAFPTPKRDGFEFQGWYTEAEGGTQVASYAGSNDVTFYAHWKDVRPVVIVTHKVTFVPQDGATPSRTVSVNDGENVALPELTKDGYVFDGWFTLPEGGTKVTSLVPDRDVTLYGHWTRIRNARATYEVTFDPQNGEETTKVSGRAYDDGTYDVITNFPEPTWEGRAFLGWFTGRNDGVRVKTYAGEENVTLYGHWRNDPEQEAEPEPNRSFSITFDSHGGKKVAPISAPEGTTFSEDELPTTTRSGYEFLGWYAAADGNEKIASLTLERNVRLHAHWSATAPETYEVILDFADGEPTQTVSTKVGKTFRFPTPALYGYDFMGWYDDEGNRVRTFSGEPGSSTTFTARWQEKPNDDRKVSWLLLSSHDMMVEIGDEINLTYSYGPKGAPNAQFVWSSSNPKIIEVKETTRNGKTIQSLKYNGTGVVHLTISTEDGSISDSCRIAVIDRNKNSTSASGTNKGKGTTISTPRGSGRAISSLPSGDVDDGDVDSESGSGTNGDGSGFDGDEETSGEGRPLDAGTEKSDQVSLTVRSDDESAKKVSVKKEVLLAALAKKLGYETSNWKVRTANEDERNVAAAATIRTLSGMANRSEMILSASDADGRTVGAAKVTKNSDDEFVVRVTHDENEIRRLEAEVLSSYSIDDLTGAFARMATTVVESAEKDAASAVSE